MPRLRFSAAIIALLRFVQLYYTLASNKFHPRDTDLKERRLNKMLGPSAHVSVCHLLMIHFLKARDGHAIELTTR